MRTRRECVDRRRTRWSSGACEPPLSVRLSLLPVRGYGLVEERQRLDARLPGAKLGREHAVGVEIRELHFLRAIQKRHQRIEGEIGCRQRSGEVVPAHRLAERRQLVDGVLAALRDLLGIALFGLYRESLVENRIDRFAVVVVDLLDKPSDDGTRLGIARKERRA